MRQRQVLCIDDDREGLEVRKLLLETFGFQVTTATSPKEGLRYFRRHHVDAVVLDYEMPEMNGGEVARKVKSVRAGVPVLILSALPWLPQGAPRECIDAFITKGGPTSKLVHEIEQLVGVAPAMSAAKSRLRAGRMAGAVVGAVAATVRGLSKKSAVSAKPLTQAN